MPKKMSEYESFEQWCKNNNRRDLLDRWDYELNRIKPSDIRFTIKDKFYFKCPVNIQHTSELFSINSLTYVNITGNCRQCNSFGQWCMDNNKSEYLDRWDYSLNKINPFSIAKASKEKCWFKCVANKHDSQQIPIYHFYKSNIKALSCKKCNSFAQHGIDIYGEDFLDKYWDYDKNTVDPWNIAKTSSIEIWIKCNEKEYHGSYLSQGNIFSRGSKCPYCATFHGNVHKLDSLGSVNLNSLTYWSNKNHKSPYEYTPKSHIEVWWKCDCGEHEDYKRSISETTRYNFRCPSCSVERKNSLLQERVNNYFKDNYNFTIKNEYNCSLIAVNPKTKFQLPYDNEVVELKLLVEVMGSQHYSIKGFHIQSARRNKTTPEYELRYQKVKDRYKRIFAKFNGYNYLEIPYWTEEDESYKNIIDEKITYIKQQHSNHHNHVLGT